MPKAKEAEPSGGFGAFLYNSERGEVFGRTGQSWAKIGIFYVIYYAGLTAFFIALLSIFIKIFTDEKAPVLTGSYSILPPNPEMGYQPMVIAEETLITYNIQRKAKVKKEPFWEDYSKGLESYLTSGQAPDRVPTPMQLVNYFSPKVNGRNCTTAEDAGTKRDDPPCIFDASALTGFVTECKEKNYGYDVGTPCIAVKMNRIYEYIPVVEEGDEIQIKCTGEHVADKDNVGDVTYWPSTTDADGSVGIIKTHFFPFLGQPNYMTPLVFVKFENIAHNVLVQVVCQPINIKTKENENVELGKVHFEVFIQDFEE